MRSLGIGLVASLLLAGAALAESPGQGNRSRIEVIPSSGTISSPLSLEEINSKEIARAIDGISLPWSLTTCQRIRDVVTHFQVVEAAPVMAARLKKLACKDPGAALILLQAIAQSEGHSLGEDEGVIYLDLLPRLKTVFEWRAAWTLLLMLETREYDQTVYRECARYLELCEKNAAPQTEALRALLEGEAIEILSATTEMRETLGLARQPRITREIEIYLDAGTAYPQYTMAWSAQRLIRETRGGEPEVQAEATRPDPERTEEVVQELKSFLSRLPLDNTRIEEEEERRLQLLRAIEFFGGDLNPWQKDYLKANDQPNPRTFLWRDYGRTAMQRK